MVRALRARGLALKEQLGVLEVDSSRGHLLPSARQWRLSAALRSGTAEYSWHDSFVFVT